VLGPAKNFPLQPWCLSGAPRTRARKMGKWKIPRMTVLVMVEESRAAMPHLIDKSGGQSQTNEQDCFLEMRDT